MYNNAKTKLANAGFARYEISAYAQKGEQCRHNINYWKFGDYLGIGAGAHAKISDFNNESITRYSKHRHPKNYLSATSNASYISSKKEVQEKERIFEFLLFALRLIDGFSLTTFENHTGVTANSLLNCLSPYIKQDLIFYDENSNFIKPSNKGLEYQNQILEQFI